MKIRTFGAVFAVLSTAFVPALAETPAVPAPQPTAPPTAVAPEPSPIPAPLVVKVPEGTELPMRLEESLSSKFAQEGDRFTVSLTEDIKLSDGTILHAGYRGVGEVIDARKNGMLGKTGKLGIRLSYLRIGDQRIRLRAARDVQGGHNTGAQVGTLLLIWPVMPFIKGKSTELRKGTTLTAFSDQDVVLTLPLPPPPPDV